MKKAFLLFAASLLTTTCAVAAKRITVDAAMKQIASVLPQQGPSTKWLYIEAGKETCKVFNSTDGHTHEFTLSHVVWKYDELTGKIQKNTSVSKKAARTIRRFCRDISENDYSVEYVSKAQAECMN